MASKVFDLGDDLEHLPDILGAYEKKVEEAETLLLMKGKVAGEALNEQAYWPGHYDIRRAELRTIIKFLERKCNKIRASAYAKSVANYQIEMSDRARERYIDTLDDVQTMLDVIAEVEEVYEKFTAIVDAFKSRGFVLRDKTQMMINQLHNDLL